MKLEAVSYDKYHHSEASVIVPVDVEVPEKLGKSRNPVKAPPVLQVSPWSLGGCGGS